MRKFFVIEVNYDNGIVYVNEVNAPDYPEPLPSGIMHYTRDINQHPCLIAADVGARFYGKLDALLVTRKKIAAAEPIEPEVSLA